jgi:hypothetical protein
MFYRIAIVIAVVVIVIAFVVVWSLPSVAGQKRLDFLSTLFRVMPASSQSTESTCAPAMERTEIVETSVRLDFGLPSMASLACGSSSRPSPLIQFMGNRLFATIASYSDETLYHG